MKPEDKEDDWAEAGKIFEEAGCLAQTLIILLCIPLGLIVLALALVAIPFFLFMVIGVYLMRAQSGINYMNNDPNYERLTMYLNDPLLTHHRKAVGGQLRDMFEDD